MSEPRDALAVLISEISGRRREDCLHEAALLMQGVKDSRISDSGLIAADICRYISERCYK